MVNTKYQPFWSVFKWLYSIQNLDCLQTNLFLTMSGFQIPTVYYISDASVYRWEFPGAITHQWFVVCGHFWGSLPPLDIPLNFPPPWENSYEAPCLFKCLLYLYLINPCVRGIGEQSRHWTRLGPSQGPQGKQVAIPTLSWNKFKTLDRLLFVRVEIYQASKCTILIFNWSFASKLLQILNFF